MTDFEYRKLTREVHRLIFGLRADSTDTYGDLKKAQDIIIKAILSIEHGMSSARKGSAEFEAASAKIDVFKDYGNSLAWIVLGSNTSDQRAYEGTGQSGGYLRDKNIKQSVAVIDEFKTNKRLFILLSDITTTVNVGDLIIKMDGKPPLTLEMKEGKKNVELLKILHDDKAIGDYLGQLSDRSRKNTQKHINRLKSQQMRLDRINEYTKDDSHRYDEIIGSEVKILKTDRESKTYREDLQKRFDDPRVDLETIHIPGGVYVLFSRKSKDVGYFEDRIYFQHKMHHIINDDEQGSCVIDSVEADEVLVKREFDQVSKMQIFDSVVGLGIPGYMPPTTAMSKLSDDFALRLLHGDMSLYFYVNIGEFLEYLRSKGVDYRLVKRRPSPALLVHRNKNIMLGKYSMLTTTFMYRMMINFTTPESEAEDLKSMMNYMDNLSEAELEKLFGTNATSRG